MTRTPNPVRSEVLRLYASGLGSSAIGRLLGIHQTTALDIVTAAGINRDWRVTKTDRKTMISLYETGHGVKLIARLMGKPSAYASVASIVRRAGISRTIDEAAALPRHYARIPFNMSFVPLSAETAWVLGLIFSDGSLRRDGNHVTISVGHDDITAIPKISAVFGGKLRAYKHRTNRVSSVQINSGFLWQQLVDNFGLVPNKGLTMRWPDSVAVSMLPHFVRGLYDGDGSWYCRRDRGTLKSSYASCSQSFVDSLRRHLVGHVGVSERAVVRRRDHSDKTFDGYACADIFTLELGHSDSVALGHWIYDCSTEAIRYERKYETWKRLERPLKYVR